MSNHTPGPWHYQEDSDAYTHIVRAKENVFLCQFYQDTSGRAEADARLTAVGPELLAAAEFALAYFDKCVMDCDPVEENDDVPEAAALRAAIAKAKGVKTPNDSPALIYQSEHYPALWKGRVPKHVKMAKTVCSDLPFDQLTATFDSVYEVWVNSHGAVAALINCKTLGLKPYEFEIVEWHQQEMGGNDASQTNHAG